MEISKKVLWVHDHPLSLYPIKSERLRTAVLTNDEGTLDITHMKWDKYSASPKTLAEELLLHSAPHEVIAGEFTSAVVGRMCQLLYSQRMQRALECLPPPALPRVFVPAYLWKAAGSGKTQTFDHWEEL